MKLNHILWISLLCCTVAVAGDYYVKITNQTGYDIEYMYVSPENAKTWQDDVLGQHILDHGETGTVTLTGYSSPIFDIRLVDEDGDSYTFWDFNVEKYDLIVTEDNLDD
jgi:hypothetical protein